MAFNLLPISKRGNFMNDAFFQSFQNDYDSAMQNAMSRAGLGRSILADRFATFRNLKEKDHAAEDSNAASVSETQDSSVIVLDMSEYINGSIAVKTRGYFAVVEASYKDKSFNKRYPLPKNTNFDGVTSAMSDEGILTITAPKTGKTISLQTSDSASSEPFLKLDVGEDVGKDDLNSSTNVESDKNLSISRKGKFFQDAYFENIFKDFDSAVSRMKTQEEQRVAAVASSTNEAAKLTSPQYERLNSYRNLRELVPVNETQAVTLSKDANGYKIVMDVKNWETSLKATEGLLIVTGSQGALSFKRDFDLPGLKDPSQINASMSEDGVLTISVNIL